MNKSLDSIIKTFNLPMKHDLIDISAAQNNHAWFLVLKFANEGHQLDCQNRFKG